MSWISLHLSDRIGVGIRPVMRLGLGAQNVTLGWGFRPVRGYTTTPKMRGNTAPALFCVESTCLQHKKGRVVIGRVGQHHTCIRVY